MSDLSVTFQQEGWHLPAIDISSDGDDYCGGFLILRSGQDQMEVGEGALENFVAALYRVSDGETRYEKMRRRQRELDQATPSCP